MIDPEVVSLEKWDWGERSGGSVKGEGGQKKQRDWGFVGAFFPKQNQEKIKSVQGIELIGVRTVREAMEVLFEGR